MKIIFAGIVLLAAAVFGDEVCVPPNLFAGNFATYVYNIDEAKLETATGGKMYFDGNGKQLRVEGEHSGTKYTVYMKYNEKKQYVLAGGHCTTMPLNQEFQPIAMPKNAHPIVKGSIGTPGDSLDIVRYYGEEKESKFVATVAAKKCVMTSSVSITNIKGVHHIAYVSFTDVSLDIDGSAFEVPSICNGAHDSFRHRRSVEGILENLAHFKL